MRTPLFSKMKAYHYSQTLIVCSIIILTAFFNHVNAQEASRDALIESWNTVHNHHSVEELDKLYTQVVVFDGQQLTRTQIKRLKRKLFSENRDYRQRVISEPSYKLLGGGLIRCDFIKEVRQQGVLWKYPAYILIARDGSDYRIVGESDNASNLTVTNYLKLRDTQQRAEQNSSAKEDTAIANSHKDVVSTDSSFDNATEDSVNIASLQQQQTRDTISPNQTPLSEKPDSSHQRDIAGANEMFSGDETVTIPLQYVYIFIGVLVFGGIVILLTNSSSRKRKRRAAKLANPDHHDHYSKDASMVFEKFVMHLFDPLYFRAFRTRHQTILANAPGENEGYPELEFEFSHKENRVRFAIESIYISELKHRDIQIASPQQVKAYSQLDEDDHDLYLVVGIGGTPDDPKEMYLMPVKDIRSPFITYPELQPYRKYGMFFYSAENQRLQ